MVKRKGWRGQSKRHSKAARGIKTGRKNYGMVFPLVKESDIEKNVRKTRGYIKIVEVDAQQLKKRFERDQGEDIAWNEERLKSARERKEVESYPQVDHSDFSDKVDITDGRHRIAASAEKNETIKIAVKPKKAWQERNYKNYGMVWDIEGAKAEGHIIQQMPPKEFIRKTGLTEKDLKEPQFKFYHDTETGKMESLKKLSEKIKDPDVKVTIPFVGDDPQFHEGRHRSLAAELAGEKTIPVMVSIPRERREELAEKFIQKAFPESHGSYKEEWKGRFKKGMPKFYMDSKHRKIYKRIRED